MATDIEFFLYSSETCHLCHDFKQRLDTLLEGYNYRYRVINIDGDGELIHRYGTRLPVLVAGGREICELGFDEAAITRFIKEQD
jgi:hypothetical protein